MVGTRQKGKLSRIPHGTRIDLSGEEASPPTKRRLEMGSPSEGKGSDTAKKDATLLPGLREKQAEERESEEEEGHSEQESEEEPSEPEESEEEKDEEEEEERPAKRARTAVAQRRARTPTQEVKVQWSNVKAKPGTEKRGFVMPSRVDFDALKELGIEEEVRRKFANIGWERFLDFSTDVYAELVREFFKGLEIDLKGEEVHSIQFRLGGIVERMSPNTINNELGVTPLIEMVTPEFYRAVKHLPSCPDQKPIRSGPLWPRKNPFRPSQQKRGT